jgi:fucose permease
VTAAGLAGLLGSVLGGTMASHLGYAAALAVGASATALGLVIFTATTLRRQPGAVTSAVRSGSSG